MRVAIISSAFPCGRREPYLSAELAALRPHVEHLTVAPLRPERVRQQDLGGAALVLQRPWSPSTLLLATAAFRRAPRASIGAFVEVVRAPRALSAKLKNAVIFPSALAIAERLHREGTDHVHSYWLSAPATAALVISRVNAITWSSTAHRWDIFEDNMIAQKAASARFIRAISERGRAALAALAPALAQKIVVIRLGSALEGRSRNGARRSAVRLLCAAAFVPTKGHVDLLAAFERAHSQHPWLELTLAGSGPLEGAVRARVRALACRDSIILRGYVDHAQLLRELSAGHYDAVVLASRDDGVREMEGIPAILIEASSLEIASIATRSGAIEELLNDESAFLAQPQDPESLANAMLDATDPQERRKRAICAARRAQEMHDPAQSATRIAGLLAGSMGVTA